MQKENARFEILEHAWRHPVLLVFVILALFFVYQIRALVVAVLFALTLASAIAPLAELAEDKYRVPRAVTVIGVYLVVGTLYTIVAIALFPTIAEQGHRLFQDMPGYVDTMTDRYSHIKSFLGDHAEALKFSTADIKTFTTKLSSQALHFTSDLMSMVASTILVLFLTSYFVIEAKKIWPALLKWLPARKREHASKIIKPLEARLGGYVRGQALVSFAVATFLGCALTLIGVDHALILAVLAGLLNLVPFVGSMMTAVLAIVVAFNQSPLMLALTIGVFAIEQWVESSFIVPMLLGSQVELHPLAVLFAILIGGSLMGLPGALIAVPLTTAMVFLAEEFYLRPMHAQEKLADSDTSHDTILVSPSESGEQA